MSAGGILTDVVFGSRKRLSRIVCRVKRLRTSSRISCGPHVISYILSRVGLRMGLQGLQQAVLLLGTSQVARGSFKLVRSCLRRFSCRRLLPTCRVAMQKMMHLQLSLNSSPPQVGSSFVIITIIIIISSIILAISLISASRF